MYLKYLNRLELLYAISRKNIKILQNSILRIA